MPTHEVISYQFVIDKSDIRWVRINERGRVPIFIVPELSKEARKEEGSILLLTHTVYCVEEGCKQRGGFLFNSATPTLPPKLRLVGLLLNPRKPASGKKKYAFELSILWFKYSSSCLVSMYCIRLKVYPVCEVGRVGITQTMTIKSSTLQHLP